MLPPPRTDQIPTMVTMTHALSPPQRLLLVNTSERKIRERALERENGSAGSNGFLNVPRGGQSPMHVLSIMNARQYKCSNLNSQASYTLLTFWLITTNPLSFPSQTLKKNNTRLRDILWTNINNLDEYNV